MTSEWDQYKVNKEDEWEQFRVTPQAAPPPQQSLLRQVGQGVGETLLSLGSSQIAGPLSGYAGMLGAGAGALANLVSPQEGRAMDWGAEAQKAVQSALTYEPRGETARNVIGAVNYPFQKLSEAGSAAADWARTQLEGTPLEPAGPIIATAIGTGIEASPLLIGLRKKGTGKPKTGEAAFKEKVAQNQRELMKEGYPVTKGTPLERFTEILPPGNLFFKKWRSKLNEMVNNANRQYVTEELGLPDPASGPKTRTQMLAKFDEIKNAVGGNNAEIAAPNLLKWINENLDTAKFTNKQVAEVLDQIRKDITSKEGPYGTVEQVKKPAPIETTKLPDFSGNLKDAKINFVSREFPEGYYEASIRYPDGGYSFWIFDKNNKPIQSSLYKLSEFQKQQIKEGNLPKIYETLFGEGQGQGTTKFYNLNNLQYWLSKKFKPTPLEIEMYGGVKEALKSDLKLLGETSGKPILQMYEKAMDLARQGHRISESKYVESLFRNASRYDPERMVTVFDPVRFKESITRQMDNLNNVFRKNPEIPKMLDAYADKMLGAANDLRKFAQQKPMTPREMMELGAAGVGAQLTGLIVPWGFETWMAHSFAHPKGWLKKWVMREPGPIIPQGTGVVLGGQIPQAGRPTLTLRPEQEEPEVTYE